MTKFGEQLRKLRQHSNDQMSPHGRLTQIRLGELLEDELGIAYSGAAISDWERSVTKIHVDQRKVLISLVKVLHRQGGIKTTLDANQLMESGNYRNLDAVETAEIFSITLDPEPTVLKEETSKSSFLNVLKELLAISEEELRTLIAKAQEGPEPAWPRVLAALMRKATDRISISFKTILWVWVWLIAWWLISPSLRLPLRNQREILLAMQSYVIGSLVVPLLIGLLVDTKNNEYWKHQTGVDPILLRLYTYQGAGIGFNLGYFLIFPLSLVMYYLHFDYSAWIEVLAVTAGLILGSLGARVVPHNLWLAYERLKFSNGAIFFVVAFLGPLWGFFFLEFYSILLTPLTGIIVILLAVTGVVIITTRQSKRS